MRQLKELLNKGAGEPSRIHERFVPCIPPRSTHQSANTILKNGKGRYFVGKSTKGKGIANEMYARMLSVRPTSPFLGCLTLHLHILFPFNKTELKRNREKEIIPHTKRPDVDNLTKGIIDAMGQAKYFTDDAQIAHLSVHKYYSSTTGYFIQLIENRDL